MVGAGVAGAGTVTAWTVVAATGHRPQHLRPDSHEWVQAQLLRIALKLRREYNTEVGISGMALGVDQWWARAVLDAELDLWSYIPCEQQADRWSDAQQAEWKRLRAMAVKERVFGDSYSPRLLHARNDGMIADADAMVAVLRPGKTTGGTASAVEKIRTRRVPHILVDLDARTVRLVASPLSLVVEIPAR